MTACRRKVLIAIALLLLMAAVAWVFGRGDGGTRIKWSFLCYSNNFVPGYDWYFGPSASGFVLVSNEGKAPVKLFSDRAPSEIANQPFDRPHVRHTIGLPVVSSNGMIVEPGKGTVVHVFLEPGETWLAQLCTQRYGLKDRICEGLKSTRATAWVGKVLTPSEKVWVTIGPVTNLSPDTAPTPRVARP